MFLLVDFGFFMYCFISLLLKTLTNHMLLLSILGAGMKGMFRVLASNFVSTWDLHLHFNTTFSNHVGIQTCQTCGNMPVNFVSYFISWFHLWFKDMTGAVRNPPGRCKNFQPLPYCCLSKTLERLPSERPDKLKDQRFVRIRQLRVVLIQNHIAAMVCEVSPSPFTRTTVPILGSRFRDVSCFKWQKMLKQLECSYTMLQTPSELHLIVSHHVCHCWSPMTHAATAANACVDEACSYIYIYRYVS